MLKHLSIIVVMVGVAFMAEAQAAGLGLGLDKDTNINTNANTQGQTQGQNQGQAQGQLQGQNQGQAQIATGGNAAAGAAAGAISGSASKSVSGSTSGAVSGSVSSTGAVDASSKNAVGQTTTVTINEAAPPANVRVTSAPDVYAPPAVTTAVCVIGASGGVSGMGWGFSLGSGVKDEGCEARALASLLHSHGAADAAKELLCAADKRVADAFAKVGKPCRPEPAPAQ
jgi:hypothetical protein